jgi:RNA polymerase sigma factor (sigma-70 family)
LAIDKRLIGHQVLDKELRQSLEQERTEQARATLLVHHVQLIWKVASSFTSNHSHDIFGAALLDLILNNHKFDPARASYGRFVSMRTKFVGYKVLKELNGVGTGKTQDTHRVDYDLLSVNERGKCEFEYPHDDERELLLKSILKLPEAESAVMYMRVYEERTLSDIGEVLGITTEAVRLRQLRATKRLKRMLSRDDFF